MSVNSEMSVAELLPVMTTGSDGGPDGFGRVSVTAGQWQAIARGCAAGLQDLLALWTDEDEVHMALRDPAGQHRVIASLHCPERHYPAVSRWHKPALRLERALCDLWGLRPDGLTDPRPWLDHGRWPSRHPDRDRPPTEPGHYDFLPSEGEGLHQIPVGPVHAGIIEPGHFRFTANGEAVVRLEQRLGYAHKGVETLMTGRSIDEAARIISRVSGDSTVAYAYAYANAVEALFEIEVPRRGVLLRGIMAEIERIAHHINDFGAICNDTSVVAINSHCAILRERCLQLSASCFGHRLMMDCVVPGGTAVDLSDRHTDLLRRFLEQCEPKFRQVTQIYNESASIQDRTVSTGVLRGALAHQFAAGGFVGRASGRSFDSRRDCAYAPYTELVFQVPTRYEGDVNARAWIRIDEVAQCLQMLHQLLDRLEPGPVRAAGYSPRAGESAAMVEAFRGDVFIALRTHADGSIARCHARDASWFQWPLLEAAIEGNIVADFPLCNKSFNCSYSGHDL